MKKHIIPACIAALLMLIVLSICLTFCHSSSDRSDDEDTMPKETTIKRIEAGSSEQTAAHTTARTTATSTVTEAPEVIQSAEVIIGNVADQVKLRIEDEELLVNGKQISYGGNVLEVESKSFYEGGTRYDNTVMLKGNALYEKNLYITPCKQSWDASFSYNTELINMRAWVSDAEEICFDTDMGITLKGVCGDFGLVVTPVRGGTMTFAYGKKLGAFGEVDQPTDITLTWEGQSLIISSGEEIHDLDVYEYDDEASPTAKKYKITYMLVNEYRYEPTIEVID